MLAPAPLTLRQVHGCAYLTERPDISRRTRQNQGYDLAAWESATGNPPVERIDATVIGAFRAHEHARGLSAATVESRVSFVLTVLRDAKRAGLMDSLPDAGRRLKRKPPEPSVPELAHLSAALANCHVAQLWPLRYDKQQPPPDSTDRMRAWFGVAYFTGLRLLDIERAEWGWFGNELLTFRASKTKKVQQIPIHLALHKLLNKIRPIGGPSHQTARIFRIGRKQLYRELRRICEAAGVPLLMPQALRRLAAEEWDRACPGAGPLLLGHGYRGSTRHYLRPLTALRQAVGSLAVPESLLDGETINRRELLEQQLLTDFRRLPDNERETVAKLIRRMA